jgi:hypothetical protein
MSGDMPPGEILHSQQLEVTAMALLENMIAPLDTMASGVITAPHDSSDLWIKPSNFLPFSSFTFTNAPYEATHDTSPCKAEENFLAKDFISPRIQIILPSSDAKKCT